MREAVKQNRLEQDKNKWIDVTLPIRNAMLNWPDDPPTVVTRIKEISKGDPVTMTQMTITSHVGTHIDAPLHFVANGANMDMMPMEAGIGRAQVIEIKDPESVKVGEIEGHHIGQGERILFKTRNSSSVYRNDEFTPDYVHITPEAARYLVGKKVIIVGLDYISVGSIKQPDTLNETHKAFLENGIWILEGLNLAEVTGGYYDLICLPMRLEKGDASPVRAILRPRGVA